MFGTSTETLEDTGLSTTKLGAPWFEFCGGPFAAEDCDDCLARRAIMVLHNDEPPNCPECGARRQFNGDGDVVHAHIGNYECEPGLVSEGDNVAAAGILEITVPIVVEADEGLYLAFLEVTITFAVVETEDDDEPPNYEDDEDDWPEGIDFPVWSSYPANPGPIRRALTKGLDWADWRWWRARSILKV